MNAQKYKMNLGLIRLEWHVPIKLVLDASTECPIKMSSHVINTEFEKYSEIVSKSRERKTYCERERERYDDPIALMGHPTALQLLQQQ